ncbi:outer membrane lipoprotein chaperone LolA [Thiorhodovibrio frisius]|uniref:Outer-membrane lipoprotein carrier protein n=1 Tax=Thiorhodovibrio frisius TaxID=631362 RepID=H8Z359_9GAMM|nr:outer membrane lipoprotein chaperone LolA [Thiorhodovibrio frisius]EIC21767.1 periplasmic chaperone LolA [Thiorhodovibrio frisius]WPL21733.1 Outer-membrane lipoprotein carrier protein precursor [Thiorhodovibrio frisius]
MAPSIRIAGIFSLISLFFLSLSASAAPDAVTTLKNYLNGLNSLSADFRQVTLTPGSSGEQAFESAGRLFLRRPGLFRWEYDTPSKQLIVADGKRVYLQDTELNQVSHRSQNAALDGTPAQLLVSDRPVEEFFKLRPLSRDDGRAWVELEPKADDSQVVRLQIAFIDGQLDTLLMEDRFGQLTRFMFTNIKRNPKLSDALFEFKRPVGGDFLQID